MKDKNEEQKYVLIVTNILKIVMHNFAATAENRLKKQKKNYIPKTRSSNKGTTRVKQRCL